LENDQRKKGAWGIAPKVLTLMTDQNHIEAPWEVSSPNSPVMDMRSKSKPWEKSPGSFLILDYFFACQHAMEWI